MPRKPRSRPTAISSSVLRGQQAIRKHRLHALLTGIVLFAAGPSVAADCKDGSICVDTVKQGEHVELHARNLREFPITYTLGIETQSLKVDGPKTVTSTLAPRESEQIMVLSGGDARRTVDYEYSYKWTVGDLHAVHDDQHLYSLPYASGKSYRIIQGYGSRFSHTGREEFAIDVDMKVGTPVHAARAGIVARVEESHSKGCWEDGCGNHANYIVILHDDGTTGEYYHLMQDGSQVEIGDSVSQGQMIGNSGNTGHTTMPHLHFAVYRPIEWGKTQSIPVRFQSADGIIDRPRRRAHYKAL
jgi:murein DD-endopeptidase MepM/ murein hydrolase activator NlpD